MRLKGGQAGMNEDRPAAPREEQRFTLRLRPGELTGSVPLASVPYGADMSENTPAVRREPASV